MLQIPLRIIGQDPVVAPPSPKASAEIAWLAYGFRPFFLAGSLSAVLLMAVWLAILAGLGYRLVATRAFDAFPMTHHLETVAHFVR